MSNEISISDDLELSVDDGCGTAVRKRLSPSECLDFAERLIRSGTRRMMAEEVRAIVDRESISGRGQ